MRTLYKIHKIHRVDYHPELDKFEVVVLCSLNGEFLYKRFFFNSREDISRLSEGDLFEY